MHFASRWRGHVHKGILYRISSNRKLIYKIPLDNPASYTPIRVFADNDQDFIEDIAMCMTHEGGVLIECYHYTATGYNRRNGIVYPDGTVVLPEYSYEGTYNNHNGDYKYSGYYYTTDDDLTIWGYWDGEQITRMWAANYLGTINNLASEVVKTPAETMKIVYTLTDINDEEPEEDDGSGDGSGDDPDGGDGGA